MIAFYARVSTVDQKLDRQLVDTSGMTVYEDRCSGSVPFAERPAGRRVLEAMDAGKLQELVVHSLDRLGRNLLNILSTIERFNEAGVPITVKKEGLRTLDEQGKPNPTAKMVISILGVVAEMERAQIRERQLEGIAVAKAKGKYLGRKPGSVESRAKFLGKPKNQKILSYLEKNYTYAEIRSILGCSPSTIAKLKRVAGV